MSKGSRVETSNGKEILIAGASFAGLSSAYWMDSLGYDVTVVERAAGIRTGGTAVNIGGSTIDVVSRMGILDEIRADRLGVRRMDFKTADDRTARSLVMRADDAPPPDDDYEIQRDVLMNILLDAVRGRCRVLFGDSIVALHETDRVDVVFRTGERRAFDLVLGCDGTHSGVRRLWFGDEAQYLHDLKQYYAITIVDKLLVERDTIQVYNEPGRAVMLNAYKNRTDIILAFVSDEQLPYDRRDERQQRKMIAAQFVGMGWRTAALLREIDQSTNFYFEKMCQIRMPSWSRGRVALVGDAAYCPSPAAGKGGSLAIDGAAALADAMRSAPDDHALAFRNYETNLRPWIDDVQADAVRASETLVPRTDEAIRERNAKTGDAF